MESDNNYNGQGDSNDRTINRLNGANKNESAKGRDLSRGRGNKTERRRNRDRGK